MEKSLDYTYTGILRISLKFTSEYVIYRASRQDAYSHSRITPSPSKHTNLGNIWYAWLNIILIGG